MWRSAPTLDGWLGERRRRTALLAAAVLLTTLVGCGEQASSGALADPPATGSALGDTRRRSRRPSRRPSSPTTPSTRPGRVGRRCVAADILVVQPGHPDRRHGPADLAPSRASPTSSSSRWPRSASRTRPSTWRRSTRRPTATTRRRGARSSRRSGTGSPPAQVALLPEAQEAAASEDGYLTARQRPGRAAVHVGAYAPQIPQVDAVVNAEVGEALGMKPGNALIVSTDPLVRPQSHAQADRADRRRPGVGADPRHRDRSASTPRSQQTALPRRHRRRRRRHLQLHRARRRPDRPRPVLGARPHRHRDGADPRPGHLQQGDLRRSCGPRSRRSSTAGWPTRSTPTSTPAATTRASSPAPPSCPTTRSAWRSTSTSPATSAAPSARWTAPWSRSSRRWGFTWGGDWSYTDPMHFEMNAIVDVGLSCSTSLRR